MPSTGNSSETLVRELQFDFSESVSGENICDFQTSDQGTTLSSIPDYPFRLRAQSEPIPPVRLVARLADENRLSLLELHRPQTVETGRSVLLEDAMANCPTPAGNGKHSTKSMEWVRKPELSQATLEATGEDSVVFTTDLPGEYIVQKTLTASTFEASDTRTVTAVGEPGTFVPIVEDGDMDEETTSPPEQEMENDVDESRSETEKSKGGKGCHSTGDIVWPILGDLLIFGLLLAFLRRKIFQKNDGKKVDNNVKHVWSYMILVGFSLFFHACGR